MDKAVHEKSKSAPGAVSGQVGDEDGPLYSVQQYIDETPIWPDGTDVAGASMTKMQWRIWYLAAAGKFFEGMVVFMTGMALPLIAKEFGLDATGHGLVSSAVLFGILIGAVALGGLADVFGRKPLFIIEMAIFIAFLALLSAAPNFSIVIIAMFGLGISLGCDYPTAHVIISESISSRNRGKLVLGAFAFQAVGALAGTAVGYVILASYPEIAAWRWMYAAAIVPAVVVLVGRFFITESPHWLMANGEKSAAADSIRKLLNREPAYPKKIRLKQTHAHSKHKKKPKGLRNLFVNKKARRATILASVPWFLQDLGTYGIGIFTPVIITTTLGHGAEHALSVRDIIHNDILAAKGAFLIDILLIVGMIFAVLLTDKIGRIRLQILGFIGCALGLLVASLGGIIGGGMQLPLIFAGFMLFNFMTNLGPNSQTYLLAGEVFPTRYQAVGAGFAASFAKIGAVMTAFLFPVLLSVIGTNALLFILIGTSLLGAVVTWRFRVETAGVSLETVDHSDDK